MKLSKDEFREKCAALCHDQWSGWMDYMVSKIRCGSQRNLSGEGETELWIPNGFKYRWSRQMTTKYEDLPESEKESDRVEADKFLALIEEYLGK